MTDQEGAAALVLLASPIRRKIVEVIRAAHRTRSASLGDSALGADGLSAAQIAKSVGLHVTTTRFHLDQLVAAGLLTTATHKHPGAGRPRKLFAIAVHPTSAADDVAATRLLTGLLTEAFSATRAEHRVLSPDEAGYRWAQTHVPVTGAPPARTIGEWVGRVGGLIDVLERWGYSADIATTDSGRTARIELPNCPFRELATLHTDVVCGIHRGLIAGTMHQLGEPDTDVELIPFAEGSTCLARVHRTTPFPTDHEMTAPSPSQENSDD